MVAYENSPPNLEVAQKMAQRWDLCSQTEAPTNFQTPGGLHSCRTRRQGTWTSRGRLRLEQGETELHRAAKIDGEVLLLAILPR